ncbi:PAS domain S-box protein [candidate division WOR-3 bacterium]|nr:PAS domain S-box protein [candidate division WOR-3 bacterium]
MKTKKNDLINTFAQSIGIQAARELIAKKINAANLKDKEDYTEEEIARICGELTTEGDLIRIIAQSFLIQSEHKRAEEQILLLDNIETIIWYSTDIETYGSVNKACADFWEMKKEDIEGKNIYDLMSREEAKICVAGNREVFEKKKQIHTEEWVTNSKGEKCLLSVTKTPKLDANGNVEYAVCAAEDITERRQVEEALRESETRYRNIFNSATDSFLIFDMDGNIVEANPQACKMYGYSHDELIKLSGKDIVHPDYYHLFEQFKRDVQATGEFHTESIDVHKDGTQFHIEVRGTEFDYRGKKHLLAVIRDITERKEAEEALKESEERFRAIFDTAEDSIFIKDNTLKYTHVNRAMERLFELPASKLIGLTDDDLFGKEAGIHIRDIDSRVLKGEIIDEEHTKSVKGVSFTFHIIKVPMRNKSGEIIGICGIARDITKRKEAEKELAYMATHDALTNLPNRLLFNDRLTLALKQAQRNQQKLAVMLLDLDQFKEINDTLGHSVGDLLLQAVGDRLAGLLRKSDTITRMGGDEFLLLFPETAGTETTSKIAKKILKAIQKPFVVDNHKLHITTSIGIAIHPDNGEDAEILIKNADIAMYSAKRKGRDNHQYYSSAINTEDQDNRC